MKEHRFVESWRHDNENRIRTREDCSQCGAHRYGVFAFRESPVGCVVYPGEGYWWGPVGEWAFTSKHRQECGPQSKVTSDH